MTHCALMAQQTLNMAYICIQEHMHMQVISEEEALQVANRIFLVCNRLLKHSPDIKILLMAILPGGRGLESQLADSIAELINLPNRYLRVSCTVVACISALKLVCCVTHCLHCFSDPG